MHAFGLSDPFTCVTTADWRAWLMIGGEEERKLPHCISGNYRVLPRAHVYFPSLVETYQWMHVNETANCSRAAEQLVACTQSPETTSFIFVLHIKTKSDAHHGECSTSDGSAILDSATTTTSGNERCGSASDGFGGRGMSAGGLVPRRRTAGRILSRPALRISVLGTGVLEGMEDGAFGMRSLCAVGIVHCKFWRSRVLDQISALRRRSCDVFAA